jgi:chromosome segregation protein
LRLKRLYLRGFKTFAEPTVLDFDSGVTSIVGPNGVGKSNVVDAMLWVLGEQAPRALRTTNIHEVIFAGAEGRRPLGLAEVTLTLDNADGKLPTDYTEVEITRRIFRSGEAEYLLNRRRCRLRDIRDLLLDTGLGPEGYSVIGQGEIDAILSVRPEDRRQLLEEAAGVRKYCVRRDEAERRLVSTQAEMRRLQDIISELGSHIGPLHDEAARALQFRELDKRLRDLEVRLFAAEYAMRRRRCGRFENDRVNTAAELESARADAERLDAELIDVAADLELCQAGVEGLRDTTADLEARMQETRHRRDVACSAAESLQRQIEAFTSARDEDHARHQSLAARLAALQTEAAAILADLEAARAEMDQSRRALEAQEAELASVAAQRDDRVRLLSRLSERISKSEQEAEGLLHLEAELRDRVVLLESQIDQTRKRQSEMLLRREELETLQLRARDEVPALREQADAHDAEHRRRLAVLGAHRARIQFLREHMAGLDATLATLEAMAQSCDGLSDAVARVMRLAARGQLSGVFGPLGALLQVPEEIEAAVATALGERAGWLVVRDRAAALAVVNALGRDDLGRLGMFILGELSIDRPAEPVSGPSILGLAADMVRVPDDLRAVVDHALGMVVVVRDLETARRLSAAASSAVQFATLAGELVSPGGELVVGGPVEKQSPLLARTRQLHRCRQRRDVVFSSEARLVAFEARLCNLTEETEASLDASRAALAGRERELDAAAGQAADIETRLKAADQALRDMTGDLEMLQGRLHKTLERRALALETAGGMREELNKIQAEGELEAAEGLEQRLAASREALVAAQIRVAQLEQRWGASEAERERTAAEHGEARDRLAAQEERLLQLGADLEQAARVLDDLPEVEPLEQGLAAAREQLRHERERADALRRHHAELDERLRTARRRAEEAVAGEHRAELAVAREEAQLQALAERLQDQFSVTPEQAAALCDESFSRQAADREAEEIKEALRLLGAVNPGAPEELERLEARQDYLRVQLDDVASAREELLELIRELDDAAKNEFLRTFAEVAVAFDELFQRLFDGGETRLELTLPDDPLNGGVEIIVRPPGKRLQNLMLLSGGERALTATAFVFALLKVRPSPFCVLDEIDAALDAASTDRFIALLGEFAELSQFILVTHNPQTITAADRLYGVTMQTPGVSMVLSVELEEAKEMATQGHHRPQLRITPAT